MDLANAALLVATIYGATEMAKTLLGRYGTDPRIKVVTALAVAFGATFLVGATAWADSQVIGGVALKTMSVADKTLVALFAAGAAAATQRTLKAVTNIGVPEPSDAQREALDTGAARSMELWAEAGHPPAS